MLPAGTYLGAAQIGLLAAAGRAARCAGRGRGSSWCRPGASWWTSASRSGPGQLPDSNSHMLTAACREAGAIAYPGGRVPDDPALLLETLEDHLIRADLLITSGGVSVGAYDVVKEVLSRLGTVTFDKVAMQPGMPQGFGMIGAEQTPIFTLPGQSGERDGVVRGLRPPGVAPDARRGRRCCVRRCGRRASEFRSPQGGAHSCGDRSSGSRMAADGAPGGRQGSHQMAALAACNALLIVPEDGDPGGGGHVMTVVLLERRHQ